jgi:hypothetical protein
VRLVLRPFAVMVMAVLVGGCTNGFPGDPGPPVAFEVDATHDLSAVEVVVCPGERVLSIAVTRDVSTNGPFKPGPVLWQLDATGSSTADTFHLAEPTEGFRTTVPESTLIVGRIGVELRTTLTTAEAGTDTADLQVNSMSLSGQMLSDSVAKAFRKNRCH